MNFFRCPSPADPFHRKNDTIHRLGNCVALCIGFFFLLILFPVFPLEEQAGAVDSGRVPIFEIFPEEEHPSNLFSAQTPQTMPQVAIIIDDMGYHRKMARRFISLKANLTFSVLPQSPYGEEIIRMAKAAGTALMLHLPMEPVEYPHIDPGPGALLTRMSPEAFREKLFDHIEEIPEAVGVNNHMGSEMTTHEDKMFQLFSILKAKKLFFIDSRTTAETRSRIPARILQLPFAQRDVFLDHEPNPAFIEKQIRLLIRIARHQGQAIGIAHPHRATYETLKRMLPEIRQKVKLVPAGAVVHTAG